MRNINKTETNKTHPVVLALMLKFMFISTLINKTTTFLDLMEQYPDATNFLVALNNGLDFRKRYKIAIRLPKPSESNTQGEISALEYLFTNYLDQQGLLEEFKTERQQNAIYTTYVNIPEQEELNERFDNFLELMQIEDPYNTDLETIFQNYQELD